MSPGEGQREYKKEIRIKKNRVKEGSLKRQTERKRDGVDGKSERQL